MKRLALLLCVAGCAIGAPPGFSGGDSWTFPLVGPLEDGMLVTAVMVNDKGPYLMGIDPDSSVSQIDSAIVSELQLHNGLGPKLLDENDTNRPSHVAEVKSFGLGPLTVRSRTVLVVPVGSLAVAGRQLRGMLGRDVIADSLVFGFDRERGVGFLATQKGFTAPVGATEIGYGVVTNRLSVAYPPTARRIAKVKIGERDFLMHLDLGAVVSQLRQGLWQKAGMTAIAIETDQRDEAGSVRHSKEGAVANAVNSGALTASGILFVPYADKRWEDEDIDGTLGLNFFRTLNVAANWDAEKFYLTPRADALATTKERIDRWGSAAISGCDHPGCVAIELIEPPGEASAPPAAVPTAPGSPGASGAPGAAAAPGAGALVRMPHPVAVLTRDASAKGIALELLVGAVGGDGQLTELPRLIVNLPSEVDTLSNQLDSSYSGTKLVVLDVNPYPRACSRGNGCIQSLAVQH